MRAILPAALAPNVAHLGQPSSLPYKSKRPTLGVELGVWSGALAMTYFLTGNPQYHRRNVVSRSCSGWEGVGPTRYGRQEFWNRR